MDTRFWTQTQMFPVEIFLIIFITFVPEWRNEFKHYISCKILFINYFNMINYTTIDYTN